MSTSDYVTFVQKDHLLLFWCDIQPLHGTFSYDSVLPYKDFRNMVLK